MRLLLLSPTNESSFHIRLTKSIIVLGLFVFLCGSSLFSQESDTTVTVDRNLVQVLMQRISSLEASEKELRERVSQLENEKAIAPPASQTFTSGIPVLTRVPPPDPTVAAASEPIQRDPSPKPQSVEMSPMDQEHMDVSKTQLNIRGFGDIGLYGGNQKGQTTTFSLGQMNLFITSNLSEHFRFLTELVFEVHQDNDFQEDLERILLEYSASDYFNLSAGRYHTAIGYYNTAYHHATWFQTATERPYIFEYEDEGGILPIHNVGLEASGLIPSGKAGLHYIVEVGNGRTSSAPQIEPVQNYVDENNHKAVNVAVFARPDSVPGLQVGFSAYRDQLFPFNSKKVSETITDAYAVVARRRFEWLNEALMIRHAVLEGHVFETPSFYSQISERFGLYRPYFRYQYVNASSQEPVFPQVGLRTGPSVGLRFDPAESVALKLQYDYTELRRQSPVIDGKSCPQLSMCAPNALALQVDYKF